MIFNEDLYLRESTCPVFCGVYHRHNIFCALASLGTVAFESLPGRIYSKTAQQAFASCAVLASQKGFEPPAFRLGGERSILLSY